MCFDRSALLFQIISESDVKVDTIEMKIKSQPAGDSKKIQEEIEMIDKIISIQVCPVFIQCGLQLENLYLYLI